MGINKSILFLAANMLILNLISASNCPAGVAYCNPELPFLNPAPAGTGGVTSGNTTNFTNYWTTDTSQTKLTGTKTGDYSLNTTGVTRLGNTSIPFAFIGLQATSPLTADYELLVKGNSYFSNSSTFQSSISVQKNISTLSDVIIGGKYIYNSRISFPSSIQTPIIDTNRQLLGDWNVTGDLNATNLNSNNGEINIYQSGTPFFKISNGGTINVNGQIIIDVAEAYLNSITIPDYHQIYFGTAGLLDFFNNNLTTTGRINVGDINGTSFKYLDYDTGGTRNQFWGANAGTNAASSDNVCIGDHAGTSLQSSSTGNFLLGTNAGYHITTGQYNFFLGASSGSEITSGNSNVGIGNTAMLYNKYGGSNEFIGSGAGYYAGSGGSRSANENVAIGWAAGLGSGTGCYNYNTIIGTAAGYSLSTGSQNIFIGYHAGQYQTTNSQLLIIDNQDRGIQSNELNSSLITGHFDSNPNLQTVNFNVKNISIMDNQGWTNDTMMVCGDKTGDACTKWYKLNVTGGIITGLIAV